MSLEEVLLTLGMKERRPITAYKHLLESSVPQAGSSSPGGAEIARMARVYWKAHVKNGEPLPYFQPYEITELNIYANVTGCDFVIYRQAGRLNLRRKQLQIVADTRLFSGNHDRRGRRCSHVVLFNDGARKLSDYGLRRCDVKPMLPNSSTKAVEILRKPTRLLAALGVKLTPVEDRDLGEIGFLDLRSDVRLLDRFSRALGRPLRIMAAGCTSRFRKREGDRVHRIRTQMVEQRTSNAGRDRGDEPVIVCLQARTGDEGEMLTDGAYCAQWDAETCGARKAGKASLVPAVSPKDVVRAAKLEAETVKEAKKKKKKKKKTKKDRPRPSKLSSHIRLDPCCGPGPDDTCEACEQMKREHEEARRPPVMSSQFLYNPQKGVGSFLAEARSLGLCDLFPWLEDAVFKANLASCSAMDIETLNAPLSPGQLSGVSATLTGPDEISGGSTALTRHVPFAIGTTSFLWKATRKWDVSDLLWRLQGAATKYVQFQVEEADDVPGQSDVIDMVDRWLSYVEARRRVIAGQKRKVFAPAIGMLRDMTARSVEFEQANCRVDGGRNPQFKYSLYGKLLVKLERVCEELNVVTYNGSKFDLINILSPLISSARRRKMRIGIGRKGEWDRKGNFRRGSLNLVSLQERRYAS